MDSISRSMVSWKWMDVCGVIHSQHIWTPVLWVFTSHIHIFFSKQKEVLTQLDNYFMFCPMRLLENMVLHIRYSLYTAYLSHLLTVIPKVKNWKITCPIIVARSPIILHYPIRHCFNLQNGHTSAISSFTLFQDPKLYRFWDAWFVRKPYILLTKINT